MSWKRACKWQLLRPSFISSANIKWNIDERQMGYRTLHALMFNNLRLIHVTRVIMIMLWSKNSGSWQQEEYYNREGYFIAKSASIFLTRKVAPNIWSSVIYDYCCTKYQRWCKSLGGWVTAGESGKSFGPRSSIGGRCLWWSVTDW